MSKYSDKKKRDAEMRASGEDPFLSRHADVTETAIAVTGVPAVVRELGSAPVVKNMMKAEIAPGSQVLSEKQEILGKSGHRSVHEVIRATKHNREKQIRQLDDYGREMDQLEEFMVLFHQVIKDQKFTYSLQVFAEDDTVARDLLSDHGITASKVYRRIW